MSLYEFNFGCQDVPAGGAALIVVGIVPVPPALASMPKAFNGDAFNGDAFKSERMAVSSACAPHFEFVQIYVGSAPQLPAGPLPCLSFSDDLLCASLPLATAELGTAITLYIRNTTNEAHSFAGRLSGRLANGDESQ